MIRSGRIEDQEETEPATLGAISQISTAETQMFEGLTLDDLETGSSTGENDEHTLDFEELGTQRYIQNWRNDVMSLARLERSHPRVRAGQWARQ
jgi:hypothetical protein